MTTTVQARVDEKSKKAVQKILSELGLDMSTAIKMYFEQIIMNHGIPFPILTQNGLTLRQEMEILKASEEAKRGIGIEIANNWDEAKSILDKYK